nr:MAG TPA: hypothetical protein [Caudoviricetes sp.]
MVIRKNIFKGSKSRVVGGGSMIKILVDIQEHEVLAIRNSESELQEILINYLEKWDALFDPEDIYDERYEDYDFMIIDYKLTEKDDVVLKGI